MKKSLLNSLLVCPDPGKKYPVVDRGEGVYLYDVKGKRYIDVSGCTAAVSNLGHGITEIGELINKQIKKICISPTHAFMTQELEEYLDKLVAFAPDGFTKAWTATSGSEAVEQAIKLAVQYHQLDGNYNRYKILSRKGSYHGNTIFGLDVSGIPKRKEGFRSLMNNFVHVSPAYQYRSDIEDPEQYSQQLAEELEQVILDEGPESIAAFVVEPVVGAALGAVPAPDGYLQKIREVCNRYGLLLVSDEVMSGFGRTGNNFGFDHWNVKPDIIATGKGMGSGYYPLSGIIVSHRVSTAFEAANAAFLGGHTYSCNPLGAAVGSFVIDYLRDKQIVENSAKVGRYFLQRLKGLLKYEIVGDVRGVGLMLGIEFVQDKHSKKPFPARFKASKIISDIGLHKGIIYYPGKGSVDGALGDHILMTPPLIINQQQVDEVVDVLEESIQVYQNEYLPLLMKNAIKV